jgi:hypothetical protein
MVVSLAVLTYDSIEISTLRSSMALTITGWTFDQPVYNPGATITLTVNYSSTDETTSNVSSSVLVTMTDSAGSASQTSDGSVNFPDFATAGAVTADPATVSVSDNRPTPGTWAQVSNVLSGSAAPFAGVAVFTSVA